MACAHVPKRWARRSVPCRGRGGRVGCSLRRIVTRDLSDGLLSTARCDDPVSGVHGWERERHLQSPRPELQLSVLQRRAAPSVPRPNHVVLLLPSRRGNHRRRRRWRRSIGPGTGTVSRLESREQTHPRSLLQIERTSPPQKEPAGPPVSDLERSGWAHVDVPNRLVRIWTVPATSGEGENEWSPKSRSERSPCLTFSLSQKWVFPSAQSRDCFAFWTSRKFDRARDAAGLKGGPHKLRHTFASHFLRRNPDLFLLARIMGHSHVSVTELYSHLVPGYLDKARDIVTFDLPTNPAQERGPDEDDLA